jgi:hypothetical protein
MSRLLWMKQPRRLSIDDQKIYDRPLTLSIIEHVHGFGFGLNRRTNLHQRLPRISNPFTKLCCGFYAWVL